MTLFLSACVVIAYLAVEPNRWIALVMAGLALGLVVRDVARREVRR